MSLAGFGALIVLLGIIVRAEVLIGLGVVLILVGLFAGRA